jgi:hypothetical protein
MEFRSPARSPGDLPAAGLADPGDLDTADIGIISQPLPRLAVTGRKNQPDLITHPPILRVIYPMAEAEAADPCRGYGLGGPRPEDRAGESLRPVRPAIVATSLGDRGQIAHPAARMSREVSADIGPKVP